MRRALRMRVAFPAEVHVEAFAPPSRDKLRDFAEAYGMITGIDQAAGTYTITAGTPWQQATLDELKGSK